MRNNNVNIHPCFGFCDALAIVFIVLKLIGIISWSWVWVLAPIWIPIALGLIIGVIIYIASRLG